MSKRELLRRGPGKSGIPSDTSPRTRMTYVPRESSARRRGLGTRPVSENQNSFGKGGKESAKRDRI